MANTEKCPKCVSDEIISDLAIRGSEGHPPYVQNSEPELPNRPFIWSAKFERSQFTASVCGSCGHTEFYAGNYKAMSEAHKKGYKSK